MREFLEFSGEKLASKKLTQGEAGVHNTKRRGEDVSLWSTQRRARRGPLQRDECQHRAGANSQCRRCDVPEPAAESQPENSQVWDACRRLIYLRTSINRSARARLKSAS